MKAKITFERSQKLLAEAEIPKAIGVALVAGSMASRPNNSLRIVNPVPVVTLPVIL